MSGFWKIPDALPFQVAWRLAAAACWDPDTCRACSQSCSYSSPSGTIFPSQMFPHMPLPDSNMGELEVVTPPSSVVRGSLRP